MSHSLPNFLDSWGIDDLERGRRNYQALTQSLGENQFSSLVDPLTRFLPQQADPDMALNNLERFFAAPKARDRLPALLEGTADRLEELLQLLSTSQFFSDLLVVDPDLLDVLWVPLRQSPTTEQLIDQLRSEVDAASDDTAVLRILPRFRQKQHLRIGVNDIIRDRPLEEITHDLSRVADACVEVALHITLRNIGNKFGTPHTEQGRPARCMVLGFGKLGGEELNYSSDIDLMFIYDAEGETRGRRANFGNAEFYARVVPEFVRLLSAHTDRGQVYRVDLRLPARRTAQAPWPALWRARFPITTCSAGPGNGRLLSRFVLSQATGNWATEFLQAIEAFVWRKYLSFAEINEIKAMKRAYRTECPRNRRQRTRRQDRSRRDSRCRIHHSVFATAQRRRLCRWSASAALSPHVRSRKYRLPDRSGISRTRRRLPISRKTEHRLANLFDWQTHRLPEKPEELRKLALRMGYGEREPGGSPPVPSEKKLVEIAGEDGLDSPAGCINPAKTLATR